jgi:aminoglycoside phosphotransferase (APT) family kinase protein
MSDSNHDYSGLAALIPRVLRAIDNSLSTEVASEIQSPNGKVVMDMTARMLRWIIAEMEQHGALYEDRMRSAAALMALAAGKSAAQTVGLVSAPTPAERRYFDQVNTLAPQLVAQVTAAAGKPDAARELAARMQPFLAAEIRFHAARDPESADDISTAYLGGKKGDQREHNGARPVVTIDLLRAYLRRKFPRFPAIDVKSLRLLPGGMGKDTFLFALTGHPHFSGELVMRKDFGALAIDVSAIDEFPMLSAVYRAGIPVPEPLWEEPDARELGSPFIVVRRVPGVVAISRNLADPAEQQVVVRQLAEGLAAIHNAVLPELPMFTKASGMGMTEVLRAQIAQWKSLWKRKRAEPSLKMEAVFAWAESNIPPYPGISPVLVHGDYGFHNLMVDDDRIGGILDWEFAHMGDPAEDVNMCGQFLQYSGLFEPFLEHYLASGGKPYDAARDRFFTVWRNIRNACASLGAQHAFRHDPQPTVKLATAGLAYNQRFEIESTRLVTHFLAEGNH